MNEEQKDELYGLLQRLASPVVAITSRYDDEVNGMIANSAVRASIATDHPRLSFYCFKIHHSHSLITNSGKFCLHYLHENQLDIIRQLGFESGNNIQKMEDITYHLSDNTLPIIEDALAYFECAVVNSMDAGSSTIFLGEVKQFGRHEQIEEYSQMTSDYFRKNMPKSWKPLYNKNRRKIKAWADDNAAISDESSP